MKGILFLPSDLLYEKSVQHKGTECKVFNYSYLTSYF